MRKYFAIARTNFLNSLVYITDTLGGPIFVALIIFVFSQLWLAIYSTGSTIEGYTIAMMLWYFVMTESIVTSHSKALREICDDVISGEIANHLNKPYNYIAYKYASTIGAALLKFTLTFALGAGIILLVIGPLKVSPISLLPIALVVLLAITLNFVIKATIGILAFWLEDAQAIDFIYSKIVFTIGGMLIPLELFPGWLERISSVLPFSYVAYYPAKLFVDFSFASFVRVALLEIFWIGIFVFLAYLAYSYYIKKVSINGG